MGRSKGQAVAQSHLLGSTTLEAQSTPCKVVGTAAVTAPVTCEAPLLAPFSLARSAQDRTALKVGDADTVITGCCQTAEAGAGYFTWPNRPECMFHDLLVHTVNVCSFTVDMPAEQGKAPAGTVRACMGRQDDRDLVTRNLQRAVQPTYFGYILERSGVSSPGGPVRLGA